jgi:hypothetical protein
MGAPDAASAALSSGAPADAMEQLAALLTGSRGQSVLDALSTLSTMSPQLAKAAAAQQSGLSNSTKLSPKVERAISWARKLLGRQDWNNWCERFVEEAYGTKNVFPTAADAGRALVTSRGKNAWRDAPVGSLLYFAADETNEFNGHAAIYAGNGKMISATPSGVKEELVDSPYYSERMLGWSPPSRFPGRRSSSTAIEVPSNDLSAALVPDAAMSQSAAAVSGRSAVGALLPPSLPRTAATPRPFVTASAPPPRPAGPVPAAGQPRLTPAPAGTPLPPPLRPVTQSAPSVVTGAPRLSPPATSTLPAPLPPLAMTGGDPSTS